MTQEQEQPSATTLNSSDAEEPMVSLIVLTYERLEFLKETLASAVSQSYRNLEIIVSDNGSRVSPAELVASFQDPRMRLRRNPTNIGQTRNYLAAVHEAHGKYVAFLHDDDKYHPDFIRTMVAAMEADPEIVLAFSDISFIDSEGRVLKDASEQATKVFKQNLTAGKHKPFYREGLVERTISGMDTLFHREAICWDDLPADLPSCSDFYMVYLFALTNQGAYYNPERLCLNRIHAGQQTVTSTFPLGMVACYKRYLKDDRLAEYLPALERGLIIAEINLAVALIKENKAREARIYLRRALHRKPSVRGLAGFVLSFTPFQLVFPALNIYKRVKKALHIETASEFLKH